MTQPLRSVRITGLLRYYELVRPCAARRYSRPRNRPGFSRLLPWHRNDRFPRSMQEPGPDSRHLNAGRRPGGQQDSPGLLPGQRTDPGFDDIHSLSTPHRWFTCIRLSGPYLTPLCAPFPRPLTTATLDRRSVEVVWHPVLQPDAEGPPLISCTAWTAPKFADLRGARSSVKRETYLRSLCSLTVSTRYSSFAIR